MGAAALFLSNIARYMQAKKYGIPIKAVSQATMGDSAAIWILLPCELDTIVIKQYKRGTTTTRNYTRFVKGTFIIRDISTLNTSVKRMNGYTPIDMGVPEEENVKE